MRKILQLTMMVFVLVSFCWCQDATMTVNGATNPTGIDDNSAFTLVFRMMSSAKTTATITDKVALIGFSNPSDVMLFENNMEAMQNQAAAGLNPLALGQQYQTQLRTQLSATGYTELQNYVYARRPHMAKWDWQFVNCTKSTESTYYEVFAEYYGDPASVWESYGDAVGTGGVCLCPIRPSNISVTFNGTTYAGTVAGNTATVVKSVANGGTSPFAGAGVISTSQFNFGFRTCASNIFITWKIQEELAYTKFKNIGLRAGGGCVGSGPGLVCSYNVLPTCSNTATPDYRYPGGPIPNAWFRDYDFAAWRSMAACTRVDWGTGHSGWLCQNLVLGTIGTSDISSGTCTYHP